MLSRTNSESPAEYSRYCIKLLLPFTLFFGLNLTLPKNYNIPLRSVSTLLIVSGLLALYGHWGFYAYRNPGTPELVEVICTALQSLLGTIKITYFLLIEHKCRKLLEYTLSHDILESNGILTGDFPKTKDLRVSVNRIMFKIWKEIKAQTVVYMCIIVVIMNQYLLKAFFVNLYHQLKRTPDYKHILPFRAYYPIWSDKGMTFPYYHVQMLLGSISVLNCGMGSVFPEAFFVTMCLYCVGLLKSLKIMIEHCKAEFLPPSRLAEYMRHCARQYQQIYELVTNVDEVYELITMVQFLFVLVIQGLVLFGLVLGLEGDTEATARFIFYIFTTGSQCMLYCVNAQRLTTANEELSEALYDSEWYNNWKDFKFILQMMIMRTSRPLHFRLSAFAIMSHETLLSIFQTSGSYFLLLQNVMVDKN